MIRLMSKSGCAMQTRISGKVTDLVKCPYCHLWIAVADVFWKHNGTVEYCEVCRDRLSKCPVCQVNTSLQETKPEPKPQEVWYNPE